MFNHSYKVLLLLCATIALQASTIAPNYKSNPLGKLNKSKQVLVHNRILARVHGKVFSTLDVQKSMDRYLSSVQPQIFEQPEAVQKFYAQNWKSVLQELVDNELMLMEAEELSYKIDEIYLREEMSQRYGTNLNLPMEKMSMTPAEVQQQVSDELICKSMMWYRVWQKALNEASPQVVHDKYLVQIKEEAAQDEWTYQMCTFRGKDAQATSKIANNVLQLFEKSDSQLGSSLTDAASAITSLTTPGVEVKVSEEIQLSSKELSTENLSILKGLKPMEISNPVSQKSRYNDLAVTRIFQLKDHTIKQPPAFEELSDEIHEKLVSYIGQNMRTNYMEKLRKRFCRHDLDIEKTFGKETVLFTLNA